MVENSMEQQKQDSAQEGAELQIIGRKEAKLKGLSKYFTGKPCKNGHFSFRNVSSRSCCQCLTEKDQKSRAGRSDYFKKYYASEEYKERKKQLVKIPSNAERKRVRAKQLYHEQVEKSRAVALKKYYSMTDEQREKSRARSRKRWAESEVVRIKNSMRSMVRRCLLLTGKKKSTATELYLGYCKDDLFRHLESKLPEGLSMSDYGSKWEIDHIYPVIYCIGVGVTDPKVINQLDNLQPLLISENRQKSDKVPENVHIKGIPARSS